MITDNFHRRKEEAENIIDLHMHTTASDGVYSPAEVVRIMKQKGRKVIAITDHDTMQGVKEAQDAGLKEDIVVIPGIEISTEDDVHVLGYYVDQENKRLQKFFTYIQKSREKRNRIIIRKLNDLGFNITFEDVLAHTGHTMTRPNIARTLVSNGYFEQAEQAIAYYLDRGKPAYAQKESISAKKAIDLIGQAGGVPVLAHPGIYAKDDSFIEDLFGHSQSIEARVSTLNLEVYHSKHSIDQTQHYHDLAKRLGMRMTVGSDFHGDIGKTLTIAAPYEEIRWILAKDKEIKK